MGIFKKKPKVKVSEKEIEIDEEFQDQETLKKENEEEKLKKEENEVKKEEEPKKKFIDKINFMQIWNEKREGKINEVELDSLSRPINDAATSGPKKMKDFRQWAWWKSTLVGLGGIVFVIALWALYSYIKTSQGGVSWISSPQEVWKIFVKTLRNGVLWTNLKASLGRVIVGYLIALVLAVPVGFAMAWYKPIRAFFDPFIQFLRCIPPIAYVPVVVAALGTEEKSKYFIIFLAVFLTMTVTIYQGVKNVDLTLVKAAYTFGARDRNLFGDVIVPSAFPFILTAMRLGVGAAMTTLVAAELTGANAGLGSYIQTQGSNLQMNATIMGIIVLGAFGILFDKILLFTEKRLTRWK